MTATEAAPAYGRAFVRRNYGNGHGYELDGFKIPGVTSVISATIAKPGLINWAAGEAARYAVDHWPELADATPTQRLDQIRNAHNRRSRDAMTVGKRVHAFGCKLAHGEPVEVPDELAGMVDAYARFLDTWAMRPVHTEAPVCHIGHRYGGTLDAIMESPRLGAVIMDIKTGGVYREVALQLAGYRYADIIGTGDDAQPMPAVDGAYVAHVLGDSVELVPIAADGKTWHAFLYCLTIYRWLTAESDVIGEPIFPEDRPA